ncbi:MAG: succinylglutamate desuccinylase/aspartoacylase family protein [Bacillota bacterium]
MSDSITLVDSGLPGPSVAIVGGVHGTERVGVEAVDRGIREFLPEVGRIFYIIGNPPAVATNSRYLDRDLNACFDLPGPATNYEESRAQQLATIFEECDGLLDIHASFSLNATPFVICEENGLDLAKKLNFPIVTLGWDALDPNSTDAFLNRRGKTGIGIECGSIYDTSAGLPFACEAIEVFLETMGIRKSTVSQPCISQRLMRVYRSVDQTETPIRFSREYADFEALTAGEVFARAGETEYTAAAGDCILFPRPAAPVGYDAFILAREES